MLLLTLPLQIMGSMLGLGQGMRQNFGNNQSLININLSNDTNNLNSHSALSNAQCNSISFGASQRPHIHY